MKNIDTYELYKRFQELDEMKDNRDCIDRDDYEDEEDQDAAYQEALEEAMSDDDLEEWKEMLSLQDEVGDLKDGTYMIHESNWIRYVIELLEDCGYIPKDFPSWIEIDWEATAKNVAMDYTVTTFQGEDYYWRN